MKAITVTVDDNTGAFDVDLTGFHGIGCDAVIKAFAEISAPTKTVTKPEYLTKTVNTVKARA